MTNLETTYGIYTSGNSSNAQQQSNGCGRGEVQWLTVRESPGTKGRMGNGNGAKVGGKEGDKVWLGSQV